MSEISLNSTLIRNMGRRWHHQRHEDSLSEGVPDISFGIDGINGWIESKFMPKFPVKPSTPLHIPHFRPEQINWLRNRGAAGGNCWLLVQVADEYFLFSWKVVRQIKAGMTESEYRNGCSWYSKGELCAESLEMVLRRG